MTEIIRLKFLRWWDALLLQLFLAIGTRMFGCIAISHRGDGKEIRAIHFAINQREFNISIRNFVERLEAAYFGRALNVPFFGISGQISDTSDMPNTYENCPKSMSG